MDLIDRQQYPQLNSILWDIHSEKIEPKVAFEIYERRWRYINVANLTESELKLITSLTVEFGNGIFLSS